MKSNKDLLFVIVLTFNRQTEQHCPNKCTSFSSERENIVLQWAFKMNSVLATVEA
jgi:hypothetical protein